MQIKLMTILICLMQTSFAMEKTPGNPQGVTSQGLVTPNNNLDKVPENEINNNQNALIDSIREELQINTDKAQKIIDTFNRYKDLQKKAFNENEILELKKINICKELLSQINSVSNNITNCQKNLLLQSIYKEYNSPQLKTYIENSSNMKNSLTLDNLIRITNAMFDIDISMNRRYVPNYLQQKNIKKIEDIVLFKALSNSINFPSYSFILDGWDKAVTKLYENNKNANNNQSLLFSKELLSAVDLCSNFSSFLKVFFENTLSNIESAQNLKNILSREVEPILSKLLNKH